MADKPDQRQAFTRAAGIYAAAALRLALADAQRDRANTTPGQRPGQGRLAAPASPARRAADPDQEAGADGHPSD